MTVRAKTALITGGALRVGAHLGAHLTGRGYQIAIHYHQSAVEAQKLAQQFPGAQALAADLSSANGSEGLWQQFSRRFDHCDVLIHNASSFTDNTLVDLDYAKFSADINLHCWSAIALLQKLAQQQQPAHAILLLDTRIVRNDSNYLSYNLAKNMLADICRRAARALAPQVRVNAIAPGPVLPALSEPQSFEQKCARLPLPGAVAGSAITQGLDYLLDSSAVTGQILFIDGGENLL